MLTTVDRHGVLPEGIEKYEVYDIFLEIYFFPKDFWVNLGNYAKCSR